MEPEKIIDPAIHCKKWTGKGRPKKILAIRFQALGDTVITLPYLQSFKRRNADIKLHLLTRKEVSPIPEALDIFDKVITIGGRRNAKLQFILAMLKMPLLLLQGYDVVMDLQKNRISVIVRKLLRAKAWSEFDKYSLNSAGERTRRTIEAVGISDVSLDGDFKNTVDPERLLTDNGWVKRNKLIVLNPAGGFPSRWWPTENYISFAKLWLSGDSDAQFVLLLIPSQQQKADEIKAALGERCIDLTGKANQVQAFSILKKVSLVLSEDSGLMHMAWVQKIPTIALFSSSKKVWSAPQGSWSMCFDSSDLPCGPCDFFVCKFGDNRCLVRYEPGFILQKAKELLKAAVA
jgi:heptosyltransferase II